MSFQGYESEGSKICWGVFFPERRKLNNEVIVQLHNWRLPQTLLIVNVGRDVFLFYEYLSVFIWSGGERFVFSIKIAQSFQYEEAQIMRQGFLIQFFAQTIN